MKVRKSRHHVIIVCFLSMALCAVFFSPLSARTVQSLNLNWKFNLGDVSGAQNTTYNDGAWQSVCVPHTFQCTDYHYASFYRGIGWYRKSFTVDASAAGKKVFLGFEGAMTVAQVYVNGTLVSTHYGGFTPFTIDITAAVTVGSSNVVAVRLDNTYQTDVPPEKPDGSDIDYCLFGGLHRDVNLIITDLLYVPDPLSGASAPGGGTFITTPAVSASSASVRVKTVVRNEYTTARSCVLRTTIVDKNNAVITSAQTTQSIAAGATYTFTQNLTVPSPALWSPTSPTLYRANSEVYDNTTLVDTYTTRFGIRSILFNVTNGFFLNGTGLKLLGTNRHETFPYIGHALPNRAQYRDARVLKAMGCNFIRLSHYPQDPAFVDACDELGILMWEEVPTWMGWTLPASWKQRHYQDIRDMIRRDRNHPSIIVWGIGLNEGGQDNDLENNSEAAAKSEDSSHYTTTGRNYQTATNPFDIYGNNYFTPPLPTSNPDPGSLGYINSEHTGHTYPTHRYDAEVTLIEHSRRHEAMTAEARTRNWVAGSSAWCAFDYNTLFNHESGVAYHGVSDLFRIPKFAYYFYQSQSAADNYDGSRNPMVFMESISNYTMPSSQTIKVLTNCDEVELFVNGVSQGIKSPDPANTSTRWCAADANTGHWWKVDLGASYNITGTEVMWEQAGSVYQYRVETSPDNTTWTLAVDKTANTSTAQVQNDPFTASNVRYVRITVTGLGTGNWASFYNFKVFSGGVNVALGKTATADSQEAANPASNGNDAGMSLAHPPIIFSINYASPGTLRADGRIGGTVRATQTLYRPGTAARVLLWSDTDTLFADGTDIARIVVSVVDANGMVVPSAANTVNVTASGAGRVICGSAGPQASGSVTVEGGQLAYLLQAGLAAGTVTMTASTGSLTPGQKTVIVITPPPTGVKPEGKASLRGGAVCMPVIRTSGHTIVFENLNKSTPSQCMLVAMNGRIVKNIRISGKTGFVVEAKDCAVGVYCAVIKSGAVTVQKNVMLME